jgi:3-phosphoshikimate 1-carboxyvinyltransferase
MTQYKCKPAAKPLDATVTLPGSKSITNRALIIAALADGHSLLRNVLLAEDTWLMIEALRKLGIAITIDEGLCAAEITGCRGHLPEEEAALFCGNSGTTIRFCTALCALGQGRFELDGIARMRQRPIAGLADGLRQLGTAVEFLGAEGFPPLVVHARGLRGGEAAIDSPESSQMVSALLLAAPYAAGDVLVELSGDIPSVPYLTMTLAMMEQFGVQAVSNLKPKAISPESDVRFFVETPQR